MTTKRWTLLAVVLLSGCGGGAVVVSSVSPPVARSGDEIVITGTGFGTRAGEVKLGDTAAVVRSWSPTMIKALVPMQAQPDVKLRVVTGDTASSAIPFTVFDAMQDASGAPGAASTFVSLTFDDTTADQLTLRPILAATGLKATFFVNSTRIGSASPDLPPYMDLASVLALQDEGHEIGGHTRHHIDLSLLDRDEVLRQVCGDRESLASMGLHAQTFAYPFGRQDADLEQLVQSCGYSAARSLDPASPSWPLAVPAPNRYALSSALAVTSSTTLEKLQALVSQAEAGRDRWVVLVFHRVCDEAGPCSSTAVKRSLFEAFAQWLAARSTSGTVTRTLRQMMGDGGKATAAVPLPPSRTTANLVMNPSFESFGRTLNPDCWLLADTGHQLSNWSKVSPGHEGNTAMRLSAGDPVSANRRIKMMQDEGGCAPPVVEGGLYEFSAWYQSDVPLRFNSFLRNEQGFWAPSALSPIIPASPGVWVQAKWKLPPMPRGTRAATVSIRLQSEDGNMTVDDVSLVRVEP